MPQGYGGSGIGPATNLQVNSIGIGAPADGTTGDLVTSADGRLTSASGTLQIIGGGGYLGCGGVIYGLLGLICGPSDNGIRNTLFLTAQLFSGLPAAAAGNIGNIVVVSDSTTATPGATITGSGGNKVLAFSNGTNWVVA